MFCVFVCCSRSCPMKYADLDKRTEWNVRALFQSLTITDDISPPHPYCSRAPAPNCLPIAESLLGAFRVASLFTGLTVHIAHPSDRDYRLAISEHHTNTITCS